MPSVTLGVDVRLASFRLSPRVTPEDSTPQQFVNWLHLHQDTFTTKSLLPHDTIVPSL